MFTKDFFIFFLFFFRYYFVGRNICGFITFWTFWKLKTCLKLGNMTLWLNLPRFWRYLTLFSYFIVFQEMVGPFCEEKIFRLEKDSSQFLEFDNFKSNLLLLEKKNQQNKSRLNICLSTRTVQTLYVIKCVMSTNVL
jgi:hypothetical protein